MDWTHPFFLGILVEEVVVLVVAGKTQGVRRLGWWFLLVLGANLVTMPGMNAILVTSAVPPLDDVFTSAAGEPYYESTTRYVPVLVLVLEAAVVAVEAALYWIGGGLRALPALLTALAANAASFVLQVSPGTV